MSSLAFDHRQDLLWVASGKVRVLVAFTSAARLIMSKGVVKSYCSTVLTKYSSFRAHRDTTRALLAHDAGILSLSKDQVQFHKRTGVTNWNAKIKGPQTDMQTMCYTAKSTDLLVAGHSESSSILNMERGTVTKNVSLSEFKREWSNYVGQFWS